MMNSKLGIILIASGSALLGGVTGYILGARSKCKTCFKSDWYDRAEEACEEGDMERESGYFVSSDYDHDGDFDDYVKYKESIREYHKEAARYYDSENGEETEAGERFGRNGRIFIRRLKGNEEDWYELVDGYEVHVDEIHEVSDLSFMNDRLEWEKETLDYYVDDDTLCEAHDEIIENREEIVGTVFPQLFDGVLSNDENVVYISNPQLHADYEIIRHTSSYQKEVLGATDEQVANAKAYFGIDDEQDKELD